MGITIGNNNSNLFIVQNEGQPLNPDPIKKPDKKDNTTNIITKIFIGIIIGLVVGGSLFYLGWN